MKAVRLLAVVAAVSGIVAVSLSSASALAVQAGSLGSYTISSACTASTLTVSSINVTGNNTSTVLISNVPAACRGLALQLTVYGAVGAVRGTATTTTTDLGTTTTVALDTTIHLNQVKGVALAIDGSGINTTWAG
ncbi:hypothetical protein G3T36_03420 [Diaminobutyricibacter tongyongensis]|uniref:Uncharacterized protein n=1 Tax=Leifsonia tongyongensis TaxID=1268043 RepID=A0A6L9XU70_9MICO|nr:hypothetical protein [Diaminobutyricibacter tongyongensis]NEN04913.1 hypothetical protein [Diaminobutyricibacter tongyongensis]